MVTRDRSRLPSRTCCLLGGRIRLACPGGGARPASALPRPAPGRADPLHPRPRRRAFRVCRARRAGAFRVCRARRAEAFRVCRARRAEAFRVCRARRAEAFRVCRARRAGAFRVCRARRAGACRAGPAAGPQPRLARLVLALREGHPVAHRPWCARRRPRRRVRRGRPGHAGLRVLRPPGRPAARLHRRRRPVGRAHERPRLPAVRRGGRGHGQPREPLPRAQPPRPGGGRAPHRRGPAHLHRRPGGPRTHRTRLVRERGGLGCNRRRLRRHAPHEAADRRLRAHRLARRARRVDRRETPGVERLRRRHRAELHQGRDPHERHDLLAHRDDRLVDAHVPRERRDPARAARPAGRGAVRFLALRRRRRPPAPGVARAHGEHRARDRARARRALRAVRGARTLRGGTARVLPPLPHRGGG